MCLEGTSSKQASLVWGQTFPWGSLCKPLYQSPQRYLSFYLLRTNHIGRLGCRLHHCTAQGCRGCCSIERSRGLSISHLHMLCTGQSQERKCIALSCTGHTVKPPVRCYTCQHRREDILYYRDCSRTCQGHTSRTRFCLVRSGLFLLRTVYMWPYPYHH